MKILMVGNLFDKYSQVKGILDDKLDINIFLTESLQGINLNDFRIIVCSCKLQEILSRKYLGYIIYLNGVHQENEALKYCDNAKIKVFSYDVSSLSIVLELYIYLLKSVYEDIKKADNSSTVSDEYFTVFDTKILLVFLENSSVELSLQDVRKSCFSSEVTDMEIQNSVQKINESNVVNGMIKIGVFGYKFEQNSSYL